MSTKLYLYFHFKFILWHSFISILFYIYSQLPLLPSPPFFKCQSHKINGNFKSILPARFFYFSSLVVAFLLCTFCLHATSIQVGKNLIFVGILKPLKKRAGSETRSGSVIQCTDPDPYQNFSSFLNYFPSGDYVAFLRCLVDQNHS